MQSEKFAEDRREWDGKMHEKKGAYLQKKAQKIGNALKMRFMLCRRVDVIKLRMNGRHVQWKSLRARF